MYNMYFGENYYVTVMCMFSRAWIKRVSKSIYESFVIKVWNHSKNIFRALSFAA